MGRPATDVAAVAVVTAVVVLVLSTAVVLIIVITIIVIVIVRILLVMLPALHSACVRRPLRATRPIAVATQQIESGTIRNPGRCIRQLLTLSGSKQASGSSIS